MLSEADFIVLNAIYLKKMATAQTVAEVTGLAPEAVDQTLGMAQEQGWTMGLPTGTMLLPEGTDAVLAYYHGAYAPVREQPAVVQWYERFEVVNTKFIGLVTEWQQTEADERVERRLLQTVERLTRDLGELTAQIPRYRDYVRRFESAMDRVDQGQRDFVCKPTIDSVHNIWFEFHEDILAVLGRPRDTT